MRTLAVRILRRGLPTAAVLALMGYGMAEFAGIYLAAQPGAERGDGQWAENVAASLRYRVPLGMAAWGFGLVALFEFLHWLVRGNPPAPAPKSAAAPDATERLLTDLLRRAEADKAARKE